jgi:hypothetical protein
MANYRVYLLFNDTVNPTAGFSERYDITSSSDDTAMVTAAQLKDARRSFLASNWTIVAVRLARLAPKSVGPACKIIARQVRLCPDISPGAGLAESMDIPAAAVFADFFYQGILKPSHRQFRGIPDIWWDAAALSGAKEAIETFCRRLKSFNHVRFVGSDNCTSLGAFPLKCCATRRISSRRVGRPFGLLRGRRSKRKVIPTPP